MKIVNVGYNYRHSDRFVIDRPYGTGDYIILVTRTPAFFVFGGEKISAAPNSVVLFKKGTAQYYGADGGEFANDWIHFELGASEEEQMLKLGIPFDTVIAANTASVISECIKNMFTECYSGNLYKEESLELYFRLILLKLSEAVRLPVSKREEPYYGMLSALRTEISNSPEKSWTLDEISKKLNLSRSYIQHLYKSFFGKTITDDIKSSRIEYAKYLLSGTKMTVSAVASACGYDSDVHFMRIFKRTVGVSPTAFRKQTRVLEKELDSSKKKNPFCL